MVPSETDEAKYKDVFFGAEKAAENCKSVVAMCLTYHALINRIPTQKTKEEKVRIIKEPRNTQFANDNADDARTHARTQRAHTRRHNGFSY